MSDNRSSLVKALLSTLEVYSVFNLVRTHMDEHVAKELTLQVGIAPVISRSSNQYSFSCDSLTQYSIELLTTSLFFSSLTKVKIKCVCELLGTSLLHI
jgi:hypothetical protein